MTAKLGSGLRVNFRIDHFRVALCLDFKTSLRAKPFKRKTHENDLDLHENGRHERKGERHFHMNGFARSVVLTRRQKITQKWPIPLNFLAITVFTYSLTQTAT